MKSSEATPARGADFPALQDAVRRLALEAAEATQPAKVEQTMRQWISRMTNDLDESEGLEAMALALALAMELESFTPSLTGTTALDRIVRQRTLRADEQAAFRALKAALFTPLVVHRPVGDATFMAEDLATKREFVLFNDDLPAEAIGVVLIARLCILDADVWGTVGMIMPLDDAGLAVALEFVRPGRGIALATVVRLRSTGISSVTAGRKSWG